MGSSEKFCLRWNDFEGNISRSFTSIRDQSQFFDCTLTTDDDEAYSDNLRAHRVILSASSEFFRKILAKESMCAHPNPLIYLQGICAQDLTHLLDFMYYGEVNVAQDELDKFLEVAESLQIKGLTQSLNRSRTNKRTASSALSPPNSPNESSKRLKVLSDAASTSSSKADHELLFKDECDLLVPNETMYFDDSLRDYDDDDKMVEDSKNIVKDHKFNNDGKEDQFTYQKQCEEKIDGNEPEHTFPRGFKHLSESERITLVNLIKTLDKEDILRMKVASRDLDTKEKRKTLWNQIVPAFNEICGRNCDVQKLKNALTRIKSNTVITKAHALFYDEYDDKHKICRFTNA